MPEFETLEEWVQYGVDKGWALRSGHVGWDGNTQVPTLVLQTDAVKDLHERGESDPWGRGAATLERRAQ